MEELRVRKYMLGPKGFKTIIKSRCPVASSHCWQMKGLGEGVLVADPQLPLVVGLSILGC